MVVLAWPEHSIHILELWEHSPQSRLGHEITRARSQQ